MIVGAVVGSFVGAAVGSYLTYRVATKYVKNKFEETKEEVITVIKEAVYDEIDDLYFGWKSAKMERDRK